MNVGTALLVVAAPAVLEVSSQTPVGAQPTGHFEEDTLGTFDHDGLSDDAVVTDADVDVGMVVAAFPAVRPHLEGPQSLVGAQLTVHPEEGALAQDGLSDDAVETFADVNVGMVSLVVAAASTVSPHLEVSSHPLFGAQPTGHPEECTFGTLDHDGLSDDAVATLADGNEGTASLVVAAASASNPHLEVSSQSLVGAQPTGHPEEGTFENDGLSDEAVETLADVKVGTASFVVAAALADSPHPEVSFATSRRRADHRSS